MNLIDAFQSFFGPLMEFIHLLVTGVITAIGFFSSILTVITSSLSMLPQSLSACLLTCFSVIIAVRVLELLP